VLLGENHGANPRRVRPDGAGGMPDHLAGLPRGGPGDHPEHGRVTAGGGARPPGVPGDVRRGPERL
jgi:hypothetical protein